MACPWVIENFAIAYDFQLVCHCNSYIVYHFPVFDVQNIVTLKCRLGLTQGHWKWHHSIDRIGVPIRLPL